MKYIYSVTLLLFLLVIYLGYILSGYSSLLAYQNIEIEKGNNIKNILKKIDGNKLKNIEIDYNNTQTMVLGELNNILKVVNTENNDNMKFGTIEYLNNGIMSIDIINIGNYNSIDLFLISLFGYKNYFNVIDLNILYENGNYKITIKGNIEIL